MEEKKKRAAAIRRVLLFVMLLTLSLPLRAGASSVKTTKKYYRVFLVGDSRTMYMQMHIGKQTRKTTFIHKNGGGLTWFRQHGYKKLVKAVKKYRRKAAAAGKPMAVVLNWGVNNLNMVSYYIPYYNKIAKKLKKLGCRLFIMSVNPYDPVRARRSGHTNIPASASKAAEFNRRLKKGTKKHYAWIDTYSYLMRTGWTSGGGVRGGDGLHYLKPTSLKIYNYMIGAIDRAGKDLSGCTG